MQNTQAEYTFGAELLKDPYHVTTIRGPVTRNITAKLHDMDEETIHSLQEYLPAGQGLFVRPSARTLAH